MMTCFLSEYLQITTDNFRRRTTTSGKFIWQRLTVLEEIVLVKLTFRQTYDYRKGLITGYKGDNISLSLNKEHSGLCEFLVTH